MASRYFKERTSHQSSILCKQLPPLRVLQTFRSSSELLIDIHNLKFLSIVHIKHTLHLGKYLKLPMLKGRIHKSKFDYILDRVSLSKYGISCMHIYTMKILWLSTKGVFNKIDTSIWSGPFYGGGRLAIGLIGRMWILLRIKARLANIILGNMYGIRCKISTSFGSILFPTSTCSMPLFLQALALQKQWSFL